MSAVAGPKVIRAVQVVIGVDTHQDKHVAVAIDQQGVRLGEHHAPATSYGYGELERWSRDLGEIRAFGVEGTGSYGAGLARFLTGRGFSVVEVNRPGRSVRYRKGKSDPTDAEMGGACGTGRSSHRHSQIGRGRSRNAPYAQDRQGLGDQGSHPGRQSDEGFGGHSSRRTAGNAGRPVRHRPRCPVQGLPSGSPRESHGGGQVRSSIPGLPLPSTRQGGPRTVGRVRTSHPDGGSGPS